MSGFTVEESNLISIYAGSRIETIQGIEQAMAYLTDDGLKELSERTLEKLRNMPDEEFAELEIIAAE